MKEDLIRIKEMCERDRIGRKLVLVPGMNCKGQMLKALNDAGVWPLNLSVHTVGTLASELAARKILMGKLQIIGSTQTEDIIAEILGRGKREAALTFFSRLEITPGFCAVLASSIREILLGGYEDPYTALERVENRSKAEDLKYILQEYTAYKRNNGLTDLSDLIRLAILSVEHDTAKFTYRGSVVVSSCKLSSLEKELLKKLGISTGEELRGPGNLAPAAGSVRFVRAQGYYAETKAVIRDIIEKGIPFDKVLIAGTKKDPHGQLLYQLMQQYTAVDRRKERSIEMPVTFGAGLPLVVATPAKLLLSMLDWIEGGYRMHDLVTVFAAGEISLKPINPDGDTSTAEKADVSRIQIINGLKRSGITWQRHTYVKALDKYIIEIGENSRQNSRILAMQWLRDLLEKSIFTEIPEPDMGGRIEMNAFSNGLYRIVEKHKKVLSALDSEALTAIEHLLSPSVPNRFLTEREAISIIKSRLKTVHIHVESPAPGKIHYTSYDSADFIDREHVYLLGLNANVFPGLSLEDPILLDDERDERLIRSGEKIDRNLQAMENFLNGHTGSLTLSYASYDTEEKREMYPAVLFNQMKERYPEQEIRRIEFNLDDTLPAIDEEDFWIPSAKAHGAVAADDTLYGDRNRGAVASFHSQGAIIPEESLSVDLLKWIDPRENGEVASASGLESFFDCKYRYYLKNILRLGEIRDADVDVVGWLSSFEIGHIYHKIFELFCREVRQDPSLLSDPNRAENYILALAEAEIKRCEEELPVASRYHTKKQSREIYENCRRFAADEAETRTRLAPEYFELEFGKDRECSVQLPDGKSFYVKGFVDRVDRMNDGTRQIIDYKTGGTYKYKTVGLPLDGRLDGGSVQLLLYYLALKALAQTDGPEDFRKVENISSVSYRFVTEKGDYDTVGVHVSSGDDQMILDAFNNLLCEIAAGRFTPETLAIDGNEEMKDIDKVRSKQRVCRYCSYLPMCKYRFVKE